MNEIIEQTKGMSQFELIQFIFFNNLQSSFFGMISGIFVGIFPAFFAVFNGYILGFVASLTTESDGIGVLWRILPHGIFELPAVFIVLGFGFKIGKTIFQNNKLQYFKYNIYEIARVFIFIILPLLIIAAFIEGSLMVLLK